LGAHPYRPHTPHHLAPATPPRPTCAHTHTHTHTHTARPVPFQVGGLLGAKATAELLASRGIQLAVVVDEGGVVLRDGLKPLAHQPLALVGTAEKVKRAPAGRAATLEAAAPRPHH
jgi:hypothetical protein